jgi:hypothetical protein
MKQKIVLSELDVLATDILSVVENERQAFEREGQRVKKMQEAQEKDPFAPIPTMSFSPAFLRGELRYFSDRLLAVIEYLDEGIR